MQRVHLALAMSLTMAVCGIATAGLALEPNPLPSGTNILGNPGFETGEFDPWFVSNGNPVITTDEAHTGKYSVAAFGSEAIRQDFGAVPTDAVLEVSFWVKRLNGPFNQYTLYYDDGSNTTDVVIGEGDDWQQFDITFALEPGKSLDGFRLFGTSAGPAYLDDFVISVPGPSALLAVMLPLGIAARRRRSD